MKFDYQPYLDLTVRQILHFIFDKRYRQAKLRKQTNTESPPPSVFILSTGRAGTKTLTALASLSKHYLAHHEPIPLLYGLSYFSYRSGISEVRSPILREAFLTTRKDLIMYAHTFFRGYFESSPQLTFLAHAIRDAIPNAKFIHLVRDPRNFVRSGIRRRWYLNHPMDATRIHPLSGSSDYEYWNKWGVFEKTGWLWRETNCWISRFMESQSSQNKLFLKAEEIFSQDRYAISKFYQFLDTDCPPPSKIKRILGQRLNYQPIGQFPHSSEWTAEMLTRLRSAVGDSASTFGYLF